MDRHDDTAGDLPKTPRVVLVTDGEACVKKIDEKGPAALLTDCEELASLSSTLSVVSMFLNIFWRNNVCAG